MRATSGIWGGRTAEQRRAERRRRLIDAATDIWGESGWAAVTMRGVCARTALNDRYFYEAFADREALLAAVWDDVRDNVLTTVSEALTADIGRSPLDALHEAISVVVQLSSGDPVRTQILLGHHAGSLVLEDRRASIVQRATQLIFEWAQPFLKSDADMIGLRVDTLVAVGGFGELIYSWTSGLIDADAHQIITHSTRLGATIAARYFTTQADPSEPGSDRG